MADTIRTIQELNQQFADNTTGDIAAQDIRDLMASMMIHSEILRDTPLTATVGTDWTVMPATKEGVFERGFVANVPENRIEQTPVRLKALMYVEVYLSSLTAGRSLEVGVFLNGTTQVSQMTRNLSQPGHYNWSGGVQLQQNDFMDLRGRADQAGTDIGVDYYVFRAIRLGIE